MHIHVLILCLKLEVIPIKIGFFLQIFKVSQKSGPRPCTIVHGLGPDFIENDYERILRFYNYIHVPMLCLKFELILIKIRFFMNFQSFSKIWPETLYYSTWSLARFHQK